MVTSEGGMQSQQHLYSHGVFVVNQIYNTAGLELHVWKLGNLLYSYIYTPPGNLEI